MSKHTPRKEKPGNDTQVWRMRWFLLVLLTMTLLVSIAAVMITQNALLVSLPGSLLAVIGFIVRWLFPHNETECAAGGRRVKARRTRPTGVQGKSNTTTQASRPDPPDTDE